MDDERWNAILTKIDAPLSSWQSLTKELSAAKKEFTSGKGISWSSVQELRETWRSTSPFIDSDGRPFVLYIYDQAGANYRHNWGRYGRSSSGAREYKFHFCWCQALETMSTIGRRGRYKAKHDVDNDTFVVNRGSAYDEKIQMRVCRFCLSQMSYQGYTYNDTQENKDRIYNAFKIGQFFEENVPLFNLLRPSHPHHTGRYPDNWVEISRTIKAQRGYKCEECGTHQGEFHVHHVNGVKDDCRPSNLKVLCKTCHMKQPMHEHMRM